MRRTTVILLFTYFALLTACTVWVMRLSTIHYGEARLEQGFNAGYNAAAQQCRSQKTTLSERT
jgi:hypothetical protein